MNRPRCYGHGFTLAEAVISLVIVSVMLAAALSTVSASRMSQAVTSRSARAQALAQGLMTEILAQPYLDPNGTMTFGPDLGESVALRSGFDDVDDYHNWTASPLQTSDGTEIDGTTDWQRDVLVLWVNPGDPNTVSGSDLKVKRVTVNVRYKGLPLQSCVALACNLE